jgi:chromosome segregation ATPase
MTDDRAQDESLNVFDTLLMPLRLPGRVVADIELLTRRAGTLIEGLGVLQDSIDRIESRVDRLEKQRMDAFLKAVGKLQGSMSHIEERVDELTTMEETITDRLDGVRHDLNERMLSVQQEVKAMRSPMDQMAGDVAKIDDLLPNPNDGPLTRLKDTLTSSG